MRRTALGELEELLLMLISILGEKAYGNMIVNELKEKTGRSVSLSAVHTTLYRLEDKGYLKSKMGGSQSERGGRRKRYFYLTNEGVQVLKASHEQHMYLWKLMPDFE